MTDKTPKQQIDELREIFTLGATKIAEITGLNRGTVYDKMCDKKLYSKFTKEEVNGIKNYLISQAEELKKSRE